jgi:hypothetical protein
MKRIHVQQNNSFIQVPKYYYWRHFIIVIIYHAHLVRLARLILLNYDHVYGLFQSSDAIRSIDARHDTTFIVRLLDYSGASSSLSTTSISSVYVWARNSSQDGVASRAGQVPALPRPSLPVVPYHQHFGQDVPHSKLEHTSFANYVNDNHCNDIMTTMNFAIRVGIPCCPPPLLQHHHHHHRHHPHDRNSVCWHVMVCWV